MNPCDLFLAVSPNGLGHARRVLGVVSRLQRIRSGVTVGLALERWQADRFADWPEARSALEACRVHHDVMAPGVTWSTDAAVYDDGRLLGWETRLGDVADVHSARLVVGDNLAGVLAVRPDALLMGSFLASDVLAAAHPARPAVNEFVSHERGLLAVHRPPMLCVGAIAMPGVFERTEAVGLAWMCEEVAAPEPARSPFVAVLGGRTGAADDVLGAAAEALRETGVDVATEFGHDAASYARCHVVVARPGLGTVHDCLAAAVPIAAAYEADNIEMAHNARRLAELGFGVDCGAEPDPTAVVAAVQDLLEPSVREPMSARMAAEPRDGLDQAAAWLANRLGG